MIARTSISVLAMACALTFGTQQTSATTIDFELPGATTNFFSQQALTDAYSGLGVNFSGENGDGGYVLDQGANFGFNAHSGSDFLGFVGGVTSTTEDVNFSSDIASVSVWVAAATSGNFTLLAYDNSGNLVASNTVAGFPTWSQLVVNAANSNIASIRLVDANTDTSNDIFAFDDLSFSTSTTPPVNNAPEPASCALFGLGLVSALFLRVRGRFRA